MSEELREKLAKVYALVEQGATEGERQAARHQLDKLLKKYNLEGLDLEGLDKKRFTFTYSTVMEQQLLLKILDYFLHPLVPKLYRQVGTRSMVCDLKTLDCIEIECCYAYFRRHMKAEWNRLCRSSISHLRSEKKRAQRRKELQGAFFSRYASASGLFRPNPVAKAGSSADGGEEADSKSKNKKREPTAQEIADYIALRDVEGGRYRKQVVTGHQLPPAEMSQKQGQLSIF